MADWAALPERGKLRLTIHEDQRTLTCMAETTEKMLATDDMLVGEVTQHGLSPGHWEGGVRAFEELYRRHADRLLLFLSARLSDSELGAVQQAVWMRVWQSRSTMSKEESFPRRLLDIARDEIDGRGSDESGTDLENPSGLTLDGGGDSDTAIVDQRRMQIMQNCFGRLDDDVATVVRRRLAGENYDVIGFDLNADAVRVREMFEKGKALLSVYLKRAAARFS